MASSRRCREICLVLALWLVSSTGLAQDVTVTPPAPQEAKSAESSAPVRASFLLQVDGVLLQQSSVDEIDPGSGAPLNQDRFVLRRARARVDGDYGYAHGMLQLDANTVKGPQIRLLAAEMWLSYPAKDRPAIVEVGAGLFLIPFGFETTEQAATRLFLEPSTWVGALFPGRRDLGARISGAWSFLRYSFAVMNGNPSSSATFPQRDPNRAKDFVGRIGAQGELFSGIVVTGGVSGLRGRGFHPGVRPTKDQVVVRDANEDGIVQPSEVQVVLGNPGEPSRNFDTFAVGADLGVAYELPKLGKGKVYGELTIAKNLDRGLIVADPIAAGRSARELGYMAGFRQYVTRHAELGVRYDHYDPDRDASDRQGVRIVPYDASFDTIAIAAAWCTLAHVRVTLEYDHQHNPLGRSRSGRPTTLGADALTLRGQLEF